jgi:hypothetical protein
MFLNILDDEDITAERVNSPKRKRHVGQLQNTNKHVWTHGLPLQVTVLEKGFLRFEDFFKIGLGDKDFCNINRIKLRQSRFKWLAIEYTKLNGRVIGLMQET